MAVASSKSNNINSAVVSEPAGGVRGGGTKRTIISTTTTTTTTTNDANKNKSLRRVSFSEFPHYSTTSCDDDHESGRLTSSSRHGRNCYCCSFSSSRPPNCCCICCIWSCVILILLVLLVALGGAIFFGYYQPRMPIFRIERLLVPHLNITNSSQQSYISADIELYMAASNVNKRIQLLFPEKLTVYVNWGLVTLGKSEQVPGFSLGVDEKNTTVVLKVKSGVSDMVVDNEEGERLRSQYNLIMKRKSTMTDEVEVMLSGAVKFVLDIGGGRWWVSSKFPLVVVCRNVDLYRAAHGHETQCSVDFLSFQVNSTNQPNVF